MFWFILIFVFAISFCLGSFLNVVAYRSVTDKPFLEKRSSCNFCKKIIPFYDNIPIFSWVILRGKCRFCKKHISFLYPFIELISGLVFTTLFLKFYDNNFFYNFDLGNTASFFCYLIFFSALIVSTRTDLQAMVIPQIFSIWLVPAGIFFAYFRLIEVTFYKSLLGAFFGYGLLWFVAKVFKMLTKKDGLGVGDMELLAMIGAFIGPLGVWFSLLISSFSGLLFAIFYMVFYKKDISTRIPFGPFLALGATLYFFIGKNILRFFF